MSSKLLSGILESFGLSSNEISVFIASQKFDSTTPSKLAEVTKIARTTVYDVVSSLVNKGFMILAERSENKSKQLLVKSIELKEINEMISRKRNQTYKLEADLATLISISKLSRSKDDDSNFEFYSKPEDIQKLIDLNEYNNSSVTKYIFENFNLFSENSEDIASKSKFQIKESRGSTKVLFQLNEWSKHILSMRYQKNRESYFLSEYKYIDSPIFQIDSRIMIVEDYVVITSVGNSESYGIRIKSKMLSGTLLALFNSTWLSANSVTEDMFMSWGTSRFLEKEIMKKKYWNVAKNS